MNTGQVIGNRFEIEDLERDLLGRGGMGDVYRGRDAHTGAMVAVKALRPEVVANDPEVVARFTREGEALRQLNHPNIVRMVDAIEEDGRHYLIMEYVPGGSLRDLLERQGRLSIQRTVEIALDVADALTRAHRLGIVHRDLKPSNVLLAEDGTPRLTDFGIARVAGSPRLTRTDTVIGTIDYLSPEACNLETLDRRTDIWAFGVMLYEMLSGERPFTGDSPLRTLTAILTQPVPDLSRLCPEASDATIDLVYRILEKDRLARIPSVRMVGIELERILEARMSPVPASGQESVSAHPPSPTQSRFATPTPPVEGFEQPQIAHNLPAQPTPFVGREAELGELNRLLSDPDVRLVTVLGVGGMGKTRLSLQAAEMQVERDPLDGFADGTFFASLAPLRSSDAIVPTIAQALGFSFHGEIEPRQQLLNYLRQKTMLLVLDNYEHLLDGADLVSDILQVARGVKILATSRVRLNVRGEQLYHLAGMDFPDWETPEDALEYSAVKLFMQSARRARPGYKLQADDLKYVSRICRLVGGMPLAILLAAAWIEILTPREIADQIADQGSGSGQSLDFLESELRDVPQRQRSMRAVFDHSWHLLSERERALMQALSVFRGGFTRHAAQEVTGISLRELMGLVNNSLLHRAPTGRYEVHELLRQYVAGKLDQMPDGGEAARDRHCVYYVAALERWGRDVESPRQLTVLAEMDVEIDNARLAWEWAVERERVDWLMRAKPALDRFHIYRWRHQEWETACRQAHVKLALEKDPSVDRQRMLARLLLGDLVFGARARDERISELEQILALLERPTLADQDTQAERASALREMGWLVADLDQAVRLFERSLALSREIGDRYGMVRSFIGLRVMTRYLGDLDRAKQWATEDLATTRAMGSPIRIAGSLAGLGSIAREQGQLEEAERVHREALALRREIGVPWGIADGLWQLGVTYIYLGRFDTAHSLLAESLAIREELGTPSYTSEAAISLARAAAHLGRYDQARTQAQVALDYCRETDSWREMASALLLSIRLALAEEAHGEADRLSQQVLAIHQRTGLREGLGELAAFSAVIAYTSGRHDEMRQHLRALLERAIREGRFQSRMLALPMMALFLAVRSQKERAVELYALACRYPYVANSRWFEDVYGRHTAAVAATLPPDVVAAAQERGRARDLETTVAELLDELGG